MGKVAEEVKSPERNLPLAIIAALVIAGSIYLLVIWLSTTVVPPEQLSPEQCLVRGRASCGSGYSTMVLYADRTVCRGEHRFVELRDGFAARLWHGATRTAAGWLGSVHGRTQTSCILAILAVLAVALLLGLSGIDAVLW